MHWRTHPAYAVRTSALAVLVALAAAAMGHSAEVVFNGLDYFSEGGQWFVAYGGDTFRVAPHAIDVRFRDGVSAAAIDSVLAVAGVTRMRSDRRGFHYLRLPERMDVMQTVMGLSELPEVELAETGFEIKLLSNPNDSFFDYQWYLHNTGTVRGDTTATEDADVDAPEAWEIETGDTTAIIAIIDTGIDRSHTDLSRSVWRNWDDPLGNCIDDDDNGYVDDFWGWNFDQGNNNTLPDSSDRHGTIVAGVAGATSNNSRGIAGLAGGEGSTPRRSCLLMAIRCGVDDSGTIAGAIDYAAFNGARVVNMSWYTAPSQCVSEAISHAYSHGVLLVAAAGAPGESWPAAHKDVMGVGGTNWNDGYGGYQKGAEIWAPGFAVSGHPYSRIYTTDYSGGPPDQYEYYEGTSLAAPQVAAMGALLFSKHPELTAEECRQLIIAGADSLGTIGRITVRRANARGALDALCDASRIDPHLSSVTLSDSSCVVLCPASDLDTLVVQITLRTGCGEPIANVPANNITVSLLLNALYDFQLCCGGSPGELNADAPTDTNGMTTATITAGAGVDPAVVVRVTAAGVVLDDEPVVDLRSVAYDGQCVVPDPEEDVLPDLDCDGIPDGLGDHALVEAHYNHQCPSRGEGDRAVEPERVAKRLSASHAFPNPLSSAGSVRYELPCDTYVEVCVYAMTGRRVRVLERGRRTAGSHSATWDGLDEHGRPVASGVYFIRISTPEEDVLRTGVIVR
ncbi:MAG: S8 family serine peptidase [Candidatus Eisenbacteria bacterium]|nr:S8 family serine peptidase [Candidatus Eisenbacteria bacterium]